ncbi:hypothetical protein GLOIN_2v1764286 [Rhizophagus irregularis DAOM 181602=DAOM 197198]|nr:hypothetical protein GLOIN_2v1764286 [Rhizophagus irregularis DAOM 181602=DAOM 197198]
MLLRLVDHKPNYEPSSSVVPQSTLEEPAAKVATKLAIVQDLAEQSSTHKTSPQPKTSISLGAIDSPENPFGPLAVAREKAAKIQKSPPLSPETRKLNDTIVYIRPLTNSAKLLWDSQEPLSEQVNELEITDSDDSLSQEDSEWRETFIDTIIEIESKNGLIESDYPRNPFLVPKNSIKKDEISCDSSPRELDPSTIRDSPNNPFLSPPVAMKEGSDNKVNENQFAQVFRGVRYPVPSNFYDYEDEDDTLCSLGASIKPRSIVPLLQVEAERSESAIGSIDSDSDEEIHYVIRKHTSTPNVTDVNNNEIEEESDSGSSLESDSQSTRITDYAKRAKRYQYHPYAKSAVTNPRKMNNGMEN